MSINGKNAAIAEALDYFLTQHVHDPVLRIAQRNITFQPLVTETYLKPFFMPAHSDFAGVGPKLKRYIGLYQINVVGPTNISAVPQDEIADEIIDYFDQKNISRNGILVRIGVIDGGNARGGVPALGPEIIYQGTRTVPITVPWWCDINT